MNNPQLEIFCKDILDHYQLSTDIIIYNKKYTKEIFWTNKHIKFISYDSTDGDWKIDDINKFLSDPHNSLSNISTMDSDIKNKILEYYKLILKCELNNMYLLDTQHCDLYIYYQ